MFIYITNILDKMKFTMLDLDTFLLLGNFSFLCYQKVKAILLNYFIK